MKRKILSTLLALVMLVSLVPTAAFASETGYRDTAGHWAAQSIGRWSDYGVLQGNNGAFRPNDALKRGEMAKILSETLGLTEEGENPFSDVAESDWFAPFVLRCYAAGIFLGADGKANPNAPITRQEAMVMLGRALAIAPAQKADGIAAFDDGESVADWAALYLAAMVESGMVGGVGNNLLAPKEPMTRAAMVTVLDRAVVQFIQESGTYTLAPEDGIILVAAGDVTLSGETDADILITPAADGKAVTFSKATVNGAITVQADNAKLSSKSSDLPEFTMTGEGSQVTTRPSGGGGGGGGGGGSAPSLPDAVITQSQPVLEGGTYQNVTIDASVGNGDVTLMGLTIQGDLVVSGGGSNTVTLIDCIIFGQLIVDKVMEALSEVPHVALSNTPVATFIAETPAILEAKDEASPVDSVETKADLTIQGSATSIQALTVSQSTPAPVTVNATAGSVAMVNVQGEATITGSNDTVGTIVAMAPVTAASNAVGKIEVPTDAPAQLTVNVTGSGTVDVVANKAAEITAPDAAVNVSTDLPEAPTVNLNSAPVTHFHTWQENEDAAVESTCSAAGSKSYICVAEGCTTPAAARTELLPKLSHTLVTVPAVAPTCTATGLSEGKTCSVCQATVVPQQVIAAQSHTEVVDAAVAATCTTPGKTEGKHCSVCGTVIVPQETVPAPGHTEVIDAAVEATCTTDGKTEGKHCSVCNTILVAQTTAPAMGHDFTGKYLSDAEGHYHKCSRCDVTDTKAAHVYDTTNCAEKATCTVCEYVKVAGAHTYGDWVTSKAPTCTEEGSKYQTCSSCQERNTESIPVLPHTEVSIPAVAATCTTDGKTEGKKCSVCGTVTVPQETVPAPGHTEVIDAAVEATCTTPGKTEGKHCSVCNTVLVAQTATALKEHTWDGGKVTQEPTGGAAGVKTYTCTVCQTTKTETIPATGVFPVAPVQDVTFQRQGAYIHVTTTAPADTTGISGYELYIYDSDVPESRQHMPISDNGAWLIFGDIIKPQYDYDKIDIVSLAESGYQSTTKTWDISITCTADATLSFTSVTVAPPDGLTPATVIANLTTADHDGAFLNAQYYTKDGSEFWLIDDESWSYIEGSEYTNVLPENGMALAADENLYLKLEGLTVSVNGKTVEWSAYTSDYAPITTNYPNGEKNGYDLTLSSTDIGWLTFSFTANSNSRDRNYIIQFFSPDHSASHGFGQFRHGEMESFNLFHVPPATYDWVRVCEVEGVDENDNTVLSEPRAAWKLDKPLVITRSDTNPLDGKTVTVEAIPLANNGFYRYTFTGLDENYCYALRSSQPQSGSVSFQGNASANAPDEFLGSGMYLTAHTLNTSGNTIAFQFYQKPYNLPEIKVATPDDAEITLTQNGDEITASWDATGYSDHHLSIVDSQDNSVWSIRTITATTSAELGSFLPRLQGGSETYSLVLHPVFDDGTFGAPVARLDNAIQLTVAGSPLDYEMTFNVGTDTSASQPMNLSRMTMDTLPTGLWLLHTFYDADGTSHFTGRSDLSQDRTYRSILADGDVFDLRLVTAYTLDNGTLKATMTPPSTKTYTASTTPTTPTENKNGFDLTLTPTDFGWLTFSFSASPALQGRRYIVEFFSPDHGLCHSFGQFKDGDVWDFDLFNMDPGTYDWVRVCEVEGEDNNGASILSAPLASWKLDQPLVITHSNTNPMEGLSCTVSAEAIQHGYVYTFTGLDLDYTYTMHNDQYGSISFDGVTAEGSNSWLGDGMYLTAHTLDASGDAIEFTHYTKPYALPTITINGGGTGGGSTGGGSTGGGSTGGGSTGGGSTGGGYGVEFSVSPSHILNATVVSPIANDTQRYGLTLLSSTDQDAQISYSGFQAGFELAIDGSNGTFDRVEIFKGSDFDAVIYEAFLDKPITITTANTPVLTGVTASAVINVNDPNRYEYTFTGLDLDNYSYILENPASFNVYYIESDVFMIDSTWVGAGMEISALCAKETASGYTVTQGPVATITISSAS